MAAKKLVKDLQGISAVEHYTSSRVRKAAPLVLAALFLISIGIIANAFGSGSLSMQPFLLLAAVIGAYMALNIGANDVANNMGPAVGGRILSLKWAIAIAAVCETAGALLAGGDVVDTVASGILNADQHLGQIDFILLMTAALLAAALWINLATYLNAPVSTTHSIVGGVLGAGMAAAGPAIVNWPTMGNIGASWIISPLMGGLIAAVFLGLIKWAILYRDDKLAAARKWVPLLIGILAGTFVAYMALKGLKRIWHPETHLVVTISLLAFFLAWAAAIPLVRRKSLHLENRKKHVSQLFHVPLIIAAALLSFAHGANDVANAVGPLAAISAAAQGAQWESGVGVPLWVMLVGALGISLGLALFGPRLIRAVGEEITRLNAVRAYCVAISASITVLIASTLGLPVSSTHIAIGGIFGVGLLREILQDPKWKLTRQPQLLNSTPEDAIRDRKRRKKRKLVRRRHVTSIVAAWVITVPLSGALAGGIFWMLRKFSISLLG